MAVWDGTSVVHTDNSTIDIGDTSGAIFDVDLNNGDARLKFAVDVGTWTVKTSIRAL
jgi:predicted rRNA methylase YqxC with S4 and FtsJ domains